MCAPERGQRRVHVILDGVAKGKQPGIALQDRPLFDVKLIIAVNRLFFAGHRSLVSDPDQFIFKSFPVDIGTIVNPVSLQRTRPHAGCHHGGSKTRAFFVGPVHDDNGSLGFDIVFVKGAQNFQGPHDA